VLVALAGCRAEPVPSELIHVWRTTAPAYQDRHLEVRKDLLVFGTGGNLSDLYLIDGVESEPGADGSTRYTIRYRADDGARLELKLTYTSGGRPSLRIEHIDDDWYADGESAGPETGA
jgi:hypothetical protein